MLMKTPSWAILSKVADRLLSLGRGSEEWRMLRAGARARAEFLSWERAAKCYLDEFVFAINNPPMKLICDKPVKLPHWGV